MVQAVSRALRATGCVNCRTQLLRSFTSIAGVQWPTQTQPKRGAARQNAARHSSTMPPNFRSLVSEEEQAAAIEAAAREAEQVAKEDSIDETIDEATLVADYAKLYDEAHEAHLDEDAPNSTTGPEDSTPWYLQVDTPAITSQNTAALARQELPPIPDNAPPILEALVEHVGVNLGLDSLTMLDLRHLDPPAALGSNLIMLIGTARSEKHLHVSADRLCRWLRTNYKLRPDADGLLGRNELKLRLKRKAKKQRLVGPRHADEADDGVRTGWVCVNVGEVPTGPRSEAETKVQQEIEDQEYIGFGRKTDGVKIVVQMLVEEKREELELERLWGGIAKRQSKGVLLEMDQEGNWQGQGPKGDMEPVKEEGEVEKEFGERFGETQDGEFPTEEVREFKPHTGGEGNIFRKIST